MLDTKYRCEFILPLFRNKALELPTALTLGLTTFAVRALAAAAPFVPQPAGGLLASLAASPSAATTPPATRQSSGSLGDPAYARIARGSGGQEFLLDISEAGKITRLADFVVRANAVDVLSVSDSTFGAPRTYTVPVDSTMSRVTCSVSTDNFMTPSVTITRPDGSVVRPTDANVTVVSLFSGRLVSVTAPAVGSWNLTVNTSGGFAAKVTGEGTLSLDCFDFMEHFGDHAHQDLFPI